jgi:hypothetical protein
MRASVGAPFAGRRIGSCSPTSACWRAACPSRRSPSGCLTAASPNAVLACRRSPRLGPCRGGCLPRHALLSLQMAHAALPARPASPAPRRPRPARAGRWPFPTLPITRLSGPGLRTDSPLTADLRCFLMLSTVGRYGVDDLAGQTGRCSGAQPFGCRFPDLPGAELVLFRL